MKVKKEKIKNWFPQDGGWKEQEVFQDVQRTRMAASLLIRSLSEAGYKRERRHPDKTEPKLTDGRPLSSE